MPCKTEFAKIIPTDQIKINFIKADGIALSPKDFLFNLLKTKTIKAFPVIINGIIGTKANGRRPVYIEIKLGIRHKRKADSNPIVATEIKSKALTIGPVIS